MAEELSVVGTRLPRKNARSVVTGKLQYYSDYNVPGQLYMSITRSQRAHARILSVDTSNAEALPGVRGIITHENVPDIPISYPDFVKILNDKVFYHGCEVAAVAADTLEIAEEAAGLIEVEYQDLDIVLDPEAAIAPGAPEVHDGTPNLLFGVPIEAAWGDVEAGFNEADEVIETEYFTQNIWMAALENHGKESRRYSNNPYRYSISI
jgi:xanthine dehydrogenase molybdenum-binding subunit